jgi:hypothetical protein
MGVGVNPPGHQHFVGAVNLGFSGSFESDPYGSHLSAQYRHIGDLGREEIRHKSVSHD